MLKNTLRKHSPASHNTRRNVTRTVRTSGLKWPVRSGDMIRHRLINKYKWLSAHVKRNRDELSRTLLQITTQSSVLTSLLQKKRCPVYPWTLICIQQVIIKISSKCGWLENIREADSLVDQWSNEPQCSGAARQGHLDTVRAIIRVCPLSL